MNLDSLFCADNYLFFNYDEYLNREKTNIEIEFLLKNLDLNEESNILDLACGHGRHSNILSNKVSSITAIDTSLAFLRIAKKQAQNHDIKNVVYIKKDIRNITFTDEYDRVILLNTVFGLFTDKENIDLLSRISNALRPSGLVCLDVINRDTVLVDFQEDGVIDKGENNLLIDRLSFNEKTGRISNKRIYIRNGEITNVDFSLRVYNYSEISALLHSVGLSIIKTFSGWESKPMNCNSKKIVIIAKKEPK